MSSPHRPSWLFSPSGARDCRSKLLLPRSHPWISRPPWRLHARYWFSIDGNYLVFPLPQVYQHPHHGMLIRLPCRRPMLSTGNLRCRAKITTGVHTVRASLGYKYGCFFYSRGRLHLLRCSARYLRVGMVDADTSVDESIAKSQPATKSAIIDRELNRHGMGRYQWYVP